MKISIIVPTIRVYNWPNLYNSILDSTKRDFELILVGPEYNSWIKDYKNIKYIRDFGSPNRCQQIGLYHCTGDIVTWMADDGQYFPNLLDSAINYHFYKKNNITSLKYGEGNNIMNNESYYYLENAYPFVKYLPIHKYILNAAIISRKDIYKLGGWDCIFDVTCIAHADLAVRAYNLNKFSIDLYPDPIFKCTHMPNTTGDHAPIHYAQIDKDTPKYIQIYKNLDNLNNRKSISLDNWKKAQEIWAERFK